MSEQARRVFFALWPADELRQQIEHETRHAARHSGGRVIPARNFHLTLAFLGSVAESRLAELHRCASATVVRPFAVVLQVINWWERQELLCLEPIAGIDALHELAGRLHATLRGSGFAIEHRPFRPHLTLARDVRPPRRVETLAVESSMQRRHSVHPCTSETQERFSVRRDHAFKSIKELRWQVERMELVESQVLPHGSAYRVLPT